MVHKSYTKDEKFIISLYEAASATDDLSTAFNRYEIGNKTSLHPRAVDAISKLLIQANFIKKSGEEDIYLTDNGVKLALRLLEE